MLSANGAFHSSLGQPRTLSGLKARLIAVQAQDEIRREGFGALNPPKAFGVENRLRTRRGELD
jgi:hypothetical protein